MSNADSDDDKIPKSPFAVYKTEADALFRSGKYVKAIKCYTQALELEPENQHCLVARSRCHLFEGQIEKALADAEASLQQDSKYPKGLFQKAEVFYIMGDFEKALVLYHRGHRLRPEMEAFRLGIQKCVEAINNSVGDPETIKLCLEGDLSYFLLNEEKQNDKVYKKKVVHDEKRKAELKPFETKPNTVKKLLGELYADREFLEKLLKEEETLVRKTENSENIRDLTVKGLNFLHGRCDFWQQQRPIYARQKQRWSRHSSAASKQQRDVIKYVVHTIDEIDVKQSNREHKKAIRQAEALIRQIDKWTETDLPNRLDVLANVYCIIGNSHLELGQYERALEFHERDRKLGDEHDLQEAQSRSIDNIGRVHAKQGHFRQAIDVWEKKIPTSQSDLESTWLLHEIGRCHLELDESEQAVEYGERAVELARRAEEDKWQMNAHILVAQANSKLDRLSPALEQFERALDLSRVLKNSPAEEAIRRAIEELNGRIIESERRRSKDKQESPKVADGAEDDVAIEASEEPESSSKRDTEDTQRTQTDTENKTDSEEPSSAPKEQEKKEEPVNSIEGVKEEPANEEKIVEEDTVATPVVEDKSPQEQTSKEEETAVKEEEEEEEEDLEEMVLEDDKKVDEGNAQEPDKAE